MNKKSYYGKNVQPILNTEQGICYLCSRETPTHLHHIYFGTANRKKSDANGFVVYLCPDCHEFGKDAVHRKRTYDLKLKQECQTEYEKTHSREEFIELIGRNYLGD